jgi:hypothetical protein
MTYLEWAYSYTHAEEGEENQRRSRVLVLNDPRALVLNDPGARVLARDKFVVKGRLS